MTKPIARDPMYRKRAFDADIIELCVRWYITYRVSYRDLVEMMAERGLSLVHTTIMRRVHHYAPEFERRWKRFARPADSSTPRLSSREAISTPFSAWRFGRVKATAALPLSTRRFTASVIVWLGRSAVTE